MTCDENTVFTNNRSDSTMSLGSAEAGAMVRCLSSISARDLDNDAFLKQMLTILDTSPHFIHSHVRRWRGQRLLATLWERGDVRDYDIDIPDRNFPLSEEQTDFCNALTDVLVIRNDAVGHDSEMWIKEHAGNGKSQVAAVFVNKTSLEDRRLVIWTPTGVLTETYRSMYEDAENVEVGTFDHIFGIGLAERILCISILPSTFSWWMGSDFWTRKDLTSCFAWHRKMGPRAGHQRVWTVETKSGLPSKHLIQQWKTFVLKKCWMWRPSTAQIQNRVDSKASENDVTKMLCNTPPPGGSFEENWDAIETSWLLWNFSGTTSLYRVSYDEHDPLGEVITDERKTCIIQRIVSLESIQLVVPDLGALPPLQGWSKLFHFWSTWDVCSYWAHLRTQALWFNRCAAPAKLATWLCFPHNSIIHSNNFKSNTCCVAGFSPTE